MSEPLRTKRCDCGAMIHFIRSVDGKPIPCDIKRRAVVTRQGQIVHGYESHFATCPNARRYRKE